MFVATHTLNMNDSTKNQKLEALNRVFSPSAPILTRDFFFGRMKQLDRVASAIRERGQHIALYGERGVGKTSLANIIEKSLIGAVTAKVTCNRTENFTDVWRKIFKHVHLVKERDGMGFRVKKKEKEIFQLDLFLRREEVDSTDILPTMEKVDNQVLFIFDEFDSITSSGARIRMADTIKSLSDNAPHVTVLIVGIAESVNDLIGDHPSIERCLKQVKLPRMSENELTEIIENGLSSLDMIISNGVKNDIVDFSIGFPHYTHLLSKYAAKSAILSGKNKIDRHDFDDAVEKAVNNVRASIKETYLKATVTTKKESRFEHVLDAASIVDEDEHGTFRAKDLEDPLNKLTGKDLRTQSFVYNLGKLCRDERGEVLQKVGVVKGQSRYRFKNPLLRAYIRLKLYMSGRM